MIFRNQKRQFLFCCVCSKEVVKESAKPSRLIWGAELCLSDSVSFLVSIHCAVYGFSMWKIAFCWEGNPTLYLRYDPSERNIAMGKHIFYGDGIHDD